MINVVVAGAKGRMGSLIVEEVNSTDNMKVSGMAELDTPLQNVVKDANVIIDFTSAEASAKHAEIAAENKIPIVIGTTGLSQEQLLSIQSASKKTAVLHAPNMSLGVNVLFYLVKIAAASLKDDFKISIEETHHTKKIDRPSGTGLKMLDVVLSQKQKLTKEDVEFLEEKPSAGAKDISITSFRKGDVVGDHVIRFQSENETLEIKHSAHTRKLFAAGAVTAARWIVDKPAGLYDMTNVLGLES